MFTTLKYLPVRSVPGAHFFHFLFFFFSFTVFPFQLHKNETTDNYAETPSESESEDVSDSVMRWSASNSTKFFTSWFSWKSICFGIDGFFFVIGADILANEISDSEFTASESVDNSDVEAEAFQNQYVPEVEELSKFTYRQIVFFQFLLISKTSLVLVICHHNILDWFTFFFFRIMKNQI